MTILFVALFVLAALAGLVLVFRFRNLEPIDRLIIGALPALDTLIAIAVFVLVKAQPLDLWSDVRLARTFAIYHGYKLYPGVDSTDPILGALHMPVSHLLFGPATLAPSATSAIYVACVIAVALILLPLFWLFCFPNFARPFNLHTALFALTATGFLIVTGGGSVSSATRFMMVHTDAAALGMATVAAGILCLTRGPLQWRPLLIVAVCTTLAVGAKQTMVSLVVALCLSILITDGLRTTLRYIVCLAGSGLAFAGFCFVLFHPFRDFLFNTVTLATHRPGRGAGVSVFQTVVKDSLYPVMPSIICIGAFALLWLFRNGATKGIRGLFTEHRWLVFPLIGLFLAPLTMKARMTIGGAENHTAILSFFFFVGIGLALLRFMNEEAASSHSLAAKMIAGLIIASSIPGVLDKINSTVYWLHEIPAYDAVIDRYERQPHETTYFPDAPLATFYGEKRFYDVDMMLLDRQDGGRPISAAQLVAAIPANAQRVAVPEGLRVSNVLQDYLAGWTVTADQALPRMVVYERPRPVAAPTPAQ
jgi:hypothetical protein